jgi:flagella basal body P-ring formation protein FlgA
MRLPLPLAGVLLLLWMPAARAWADGIRLLPVPSATIGAGQIIGSDDVSERRFKTTPRSLSGIATEKDDITGKMARRPLQAGRPIPLSALMKPLSVRRGSKVTATFAEAGLSISIQLTALEDGAIGDVITARNVSTGATVQATVIAAGQLAVSAQ